MVSTRGELSCQPSFDALAGSAPCDSLAGAADFVCGFVPGVVSGFVSGVVSGFVCGSGGVSVVGAAGSVVMATGEIPPADAWFREFCSLSLHTAAGARVFSGILEPPASLGQSFPSWRAAFRIRPRRAVPARTWWCAETTPSRTGSPPNSAVSTANRSPSSSRSPRPPHARPSWAARVPRRPRCSTGSTRRWAGRAPTVVSTAGPPPPNPRAGSGCWRSPS